MLVSFGKTGDTFNLEITNGEAISTDRLLIATGGYPKAKF
jgi:thioredoxin reductase